MDNAVALVQAYLRLHGYFTVTEFPVVEALRHGGYRSATDLDVLAVRFAHAGHVGPRHRSARDDDDHLAADPALDVPADRPDMIIAEVKEGAAVLNAAATDPAVLQAALVRFGCCPHADVPGLVTALLRRGHTTLPNGHQVRLLAFGATVGVPDGPYRCVALGDVVDYLRRYVHAHFDALRAMNPKDPAFGFLLTIEKALRGRPAVSAPGAAGSDDPPALADLVATPTHARLGATR